MMAIHPKDPGTIPMGEVLGPVAFRQGKIPTKPAAGAFRLTPPAGVLADGPAPEQGRLDFAAAPAPAEEALAYDKANPFSIPPFLRRT